MSLRVQFLTDDEGGYYHIGGLPGIDILRVAKYWNLTDEEALWLYSDLYLHPRHVELSLDETLSDLFNAAETAVGLPKHNWGQGRRPYELLLRIDGNLYRFSDTGMRLNKLRKYYQEEQITDAFLNLKNRAGEVILGHKGFRFEIHTDEHGSHNEPHVHVSISNGKTAVLGIPNGNDLSKGRSRFPKAKLAEARDIVIENSAELMDEWRKAVDGIIRITTEGLNPAVIKDQGSYNYLAPNY